MSRLLALAALASVAAAPALAQDGPVSTATPDPVGISPPTVAGSAKDVRIDGGRLALARQVFAIVGEPELAASTRTLTAGMSVQLAAALPDRDPARVRALLGAVGDGLASVAPDLQDQAVSRIARGFTEDQLKEMLAFYQTPTGRLAARRMPLYTREAMGAVLLFAPKMMEAVRDSYCAKVRCTRSEMKALADVGERMSAAAPQG
jgi:hypothetical protein